MRAELRFSYFYCTAGDYFVSKWRQRHEYHKDFSHIFSLFHCGHFRHLNLFSYWRYRNILICNLQKKRKLITSSLCTASRAVHKQKWFICVRNHLNTAGGVSWKLRFCCPNPVPHPPVLPGCRGQDNKVWCKDGVRSVMVWWLGWWPFCFQLQKPGWELLMRPNCVNNEETISWRWLGRGNQAFPMTALWKESRNSQEMTQLAQCWELFNYFHREQCDITKSTRSEKSIRGLLLLRPRDVMWFWSKQGSSSQSICLTAPPLLTLGISLIINQGLDLTSAVNSQLNSVAPRATHSFTHDRMGEGNKVRGVMGWNKDS